VSSVYDTFTAEASQTVAVRELRKLDPNFTLEEWQQDVVEHTLPQIMKWFLEGKINQLEPWLGEGVFKRLAAEMTARKQEGVLIDSHVLGIMNSDILACEVSRRRVPASSSSEAACCQEMPNLPAVSSCTLSVLA
jgi:mitochondrial import inner membrane translocase subunit TIM44